MTSRLSSPVSQHHSVHITGQHIVVCHLAQLPVELPLFLRPPAMDALSQSDALDAGQVGQHVPRQRRHPGVGKVQFLEGPQPAENGQTQCLELGVLREVQHLQALEALEPVGLDLPQLAHPAEGQLNQVLELREGPPVDGDDGVVVQIQVAQREAAQRRDLRQAVGRQGQALDEGHAALVAAGNAADPVVRQVHDDRLAVDFGGKHVHVEVLEAVVAEVHLGQREPCQRPGRQALQGVVAQVQVLQVTQPAQGVGADLEIRERTGEEV